jgi:hypothetical protein
MKNRILVLCLAALMGIASADNLFFKVIDGDSPSINVSTADILVCITSEGSFTSGGGTGGGGSGGGGAGGAGDEIIVSPPHASSGCLNERTNHLGEASFNIEYRGLDSMDLWYRIQRSGYKNATGSISMTVQTIPAPSMGGFYVRELGLNIDLTRILLQRNPILRQSLYSKCPDGKCSYGSKYVNVSMQQQGNAFRLRWGDIFPTCAADHSGNVDTARCAAEFLVPNMHLQSIVNIVWQMLLSIFRVELSIQGLFDLLLGIVTCIFVIFLLFIFEFIKNYLFYLAVPYVSWNALLAVLVQKNLMSESTLVWFLPLTVLMMFLGTCWLIGSDINLWRPLIIW